MHTDLPPIFLPEIVVPGRRLGRHILHDPASLRYVLPESAAQSVAWERRIPILDQGNLGSCTGNATVGALASGSLYDALQTAMPTLTLDERLAVSIYSAAEKLDGGAGYPPEDQGSSGLSVAKVSKADGYVAGYLHATSVAAAHTALQTGPFIDGIYWFRDADQPRADGTVKITDWSSSAIRGGHETMCREYDATRDLFWFDNSWGTSYGLAGRYALDTETFAKLLSMRGDVTSFVPIDKPAPTPTPATHTVTYPDDAYQRMGAFADRHPTWHIAQDWKAATG